MFNQTILHWFAKEYMNTNTDNSLPSIHSVNLFINHFPSFCLSKNQVQNLAIRGQQGATTSCSHTQTLQALSLKQSPVPIQPANLKNPSQVAQASTGAKGGSSDSSSEAGKKGDNSEPRAINMSRNVTSISAQPLIAPGKWSLQLNCLNSSNKVKV